MIIRGKWIYVEGREKVWCSLHHNHHHLASNGIACLSSCSSTRKILLLNNTVKLTISTSFLLPSKWMFYILWSFASFSRTLAQFQKCVKGTQIFNYPRWGRISRSSVYHVKKHVETHLSFYYSLVSNRRHALNKHNTGPFSTILINITYLISVTVALKSKF